MTTIPAPSRKVAARPFVAGRLLASLAGTIVASHVRVTGECQAGGTLMGRIVWT